MMHMQSLVPEGSVQLIVPTRVGNKLTEYDILLLQDAFLCKGLHYIQATNNRVGRAFITLFLNALRLSGEIGCLTMENSPLNANIIDLQEALRGIHPVKSITEDSIEQFFIESCYYDFIWIELSKELEAQPWYKFFRENMVKYRHAPIVFLSFVEK
ncbi:MAG: hypothetical protein P4L31_03895 [Candidatus Babeliales bacterium]|nr:hypothetical protein [Candidatus Babeliales bacterium]